MGREKLKAPRPHMEPSDCYPISILPQMSRLFLDYCAAPAALAPFFPNSPHGSLWRSGVGLSSAAAPISSPIADLLEAQNRAWDAGPAALGNIARLREGARAVITGQQVGLFGGPLYTLHKAATAVRRAQEATEGGTPTVPIFWLATEDHDFAEIDHVGLPSRRALETVRLAHERSQGKAPVGALALGPGVIQALDEAGPILGGTPEFELLERCWTPKATFAGAFGTWLAETFREQGLIVIDAAGRDFHALGRDVLRAAITDAAALEDKLLARNRELAARGYHAQVLVAPGASLLFLIDAQSGARLPLKRVGSSWTAGRHTYSAAELLAILDAEPERLSPNALLRPVFQDAILPTLAYIGGPAEVAYFAQTSVVAEHILGRMTPVLPRLSATLVEPRIAEAMERFGLTLPDLLTIAPSELAQRVGARAMPVEGKQKLAAAGNALDAELTALTGWMRSLDEGLGRSADTAASKMRYQMNRLRRLAANHQLEREAGLTRQVDTVALALAPGQHPQERAVGAAWFLARAGADLPAMLVDAAGQDCPGHKLLRL
jgi:bacillithiol biosynthesis cysteine-adding enzyme BshC